MSSKFILIILSYAVLKLVRFFETLCILANIVGVCWRNCIFCVWCDPVGARKFWFLILGVIPPKSLEPPITHADSNFQLHDFARYYKYLQINQSIHLYFRREPIEQQIVTRYRKSVLLLSNEVIKYKKALLSQRRPRDAPNTWVPWKVSRVLANAPGYFSQNL